jgi:hypothetical protein
MSLSCGGVLEDILGDSDCFFMVNCRLLSSTVGCGVQRWPQDRALPCRFIARIYSMFQIKPSCFRLRQRIEGFLDDARMSRKNEISNWESRGPAGRNHGNKGNHVAVSPLPGP